MLQHTERMCHVDDGFPDIFAHAFEDRARQLSACVAAPLLLAAVPVLLLLLRVGLLQVPSHWVTTRRLLRDGELAFSLLGSYAAVRALVARPILEAHSATQTVSYNEAAPLAPPTCWKGMECQR